MRSPLTDEEAASEYKSHHMRCSIIQNIKIPIFEFYSVFIMFIFYNFFKKNYLYFVIANLQKHQHMQAVLWNPLTDQEATSEYKSHHTWNAAEFRC